MDLSILIEGVKLNIRVTILLETKKGFVFQNTGNGFFFPVGGRIKINETSIEAAKRELQEELNIEIEKFEYIATLENFFIEKTLFHEINIIYYAKMDEVDLPKDFYIYNDKNIRDVVIKPECIKNMIINKKFNQGHVIEKDY